MKEIQAALGHSTLAMTSDLYTHLFAELRRDVADAMERALFGA